MIYVFTLCFLFLLDPTAQGSRAIYAKPGLEAAIALTFAYGEALQLRPEDVLLIARTLRALPPVTQIC